MRQSGHARLRTAGEATDLLSSVLILFLGGHSLDPSKLAFLERL